MKYQLSEHIATFYLTELYQKNPEIFLNLEKLNVSKNTQSLTNDKINSSIIFKPSSDSTFSIKYENSMIDIRYYTIDTNSSGRLSCVEISETEDNKIAIKKFLESCYTFKNSFPYENMIAVNELSSSIWIQGEPMVIQTLDHLYIQKEMIEDIQSRISKFNSQKNRFIKFGKAWKLNIMLSGVPGSGKTSLVKAISHYYKKPLYVMQINKDTTFKNIQYSLKFIEPNSILLIEDIDSYFNGRDTKDAGISFSTFLNILDGVSGQQNGLITFLTANYPETLDKAILRPGRIDYIANFDYPKKREIQLAFFDLVENATEELFQKFYNCVKGYKMSMSGIVDYLFLFGESNQLIVDNIERFINNQQLVRSTIDKDATEKMYS